ncbi:MULTISPECIES: hypothetical protein [unclassified Psychrobacter]|uniref:hypothetical protein n=1 Tax=unclassified Psychrobacter TaxID=196806 RepID=UPI0025B2B16D|nr:MULTISPECIES: hypothetical protein [unclassified Psychrobacter]MDN3453169.1 hypothetical protein [Psychrobacter sp. APC 3350]MDN3503105.1 hypothetical protein [Psychrobacter sp. 5A.1]
MKKSNQFASPFSAWSGHRLFHVVAGTLIGAMVVTQASAMLPTPEQAVDSSMAIQTDANQSNNSSAQAVNSRITASLVSVDANGQEVLVPVDTNTRLQSGNVLEYQGYFTNTNADRVRKMTVTMSIPEQVELLKTVTPDFPYGSVDGNNFARMPLRTKVNNQLQDVAPKYYKAVRWDLEGVGLNDTVAVKYRARVK